MSAYGGASPTTGSPHGYSHHRRIRSESGRRDEGEGYRAKPALDGAASLEPGPPMLWAIFLAAAVVLPCTALGQPSDYRTTAATQACERLTMVHTSAENAKRGIGGVRLGCASVPNGTEVRLITHEGDVAQSSFARSMVRLRRWLLMSVLGPNGI